MKVGRKRITNPTLPAGVRLIAGRFYWQPTSAAERAARKAAGLPASVPLGATLDTQARKRWAELAGFRDAPLAADGTLGELLDLFETEGLKFKLNGKPRAAKTITAYKAAIAFWRDKWGTARFARTAADALAQRGLSKVDVQRFLHSAERKVQANRYVAALSSVYAYAIAVAGRTDYNPCLAVRKNEETPRDREALPWEVEVLRTVATPLMELMMRFENLTGWREKDLRLLSLPQLLAQGIRLRQSKRGKRQLWLWTDELRAIVKDAQALPRRRVRGRENVDTTAVFATRNGTAMSESGFQKNWQRTVARANRLLAECEIPLKIEDLHFHDLRASAADDAVDAGQDRATFLGDNPQTASKHYARRERVVRPLR